MNMLRKVLLWLKQLDDSSKNWTKPGGWSDATTYAGNLKAFVLSLAFLLGASHVDDFGKWLWRLFGRELIQNQGAEGTHFIVFTAIGAFGCVACILNMLKIYRMRRILTVNEATENISSSSSVENQPNSSSSNNENAG